MSVPKVVIMLPVAIRAAMKLYSPKPLSPRERAAAMVKTAIAP